MSSPAWIQFPNIVVSLWATNLSVESSSAKVLGTPHPLDKIAPALATTFDNHPRTSESMHQQLPHGKGE
jgi:hypothetical protein